MIARPFRIEDKEGVIRLLCSNSIWPSAEIDIEPSKYWDWKFLRNPAGSGIICVVEEKGEVISHAAAVPIFIWVRGEVVLGSQGVDVLTHPEYRHKNAAMLAIKCRNEQREKKNVQIDLAFTSDRFHADFAKKSGHKEIGVDMVRYELITRPSLFFKGGFLEKSKKLMYEQYIRLRRFITLNGILGADDLKIIPGNRFDENIDDLVSSALIQFDLAVFKDQEYLNWRYADKDAGEFNILLAYENGTVIGYIVFKFIGNKPVKYGEIVDILVRPGSNYAATILLAEAIERLLEKGAVSVYCWLPSRHPYTSSLRKIGFLRPRKQNDQSMIILYKDRSDKRIMQGIVEERRKKVHFVFGDSDWI
ncbi:MAG: GNAT family N-acetyltransferase [Methanomassiliicoccales archaeon]|nr:GNAT family N-acetyltransferase [Methanomassiliicoccales archaeon]